MVRSLVIVTWAVALTSSVSEAQGIPSAPSFRLDSCLVTCPAADSVFCIRDIRIFGQVAAGQDLVLDFYSCPGVVLPEEPPGSTYDVDPPIPTALTVTDATGSGCFPLAMGGVSGSNRVKMYVSGAHMGEGPIPASFDQNGDLVVDDADLALIEAKVGTSDATADFDCDGAVTSADRAIANTHRGHGYWQNVGVGDGPAIAFGVRVAPNPATGPVELELRAPRGGHAVLAIHDVSGRRIATLLDRHVEPGIHRAGWSGRDASGRPMPAGLYLYRARVGAHEARGAVILAR